MKKIVLSFLIFCFVFVVGIFLGRYIPHFTTAVVKESIAGGVARNVRKEVAKPYTLTSARVKRVIDGDTIELEGGERVRYIGINSPELRDTREKVACFAAKAREVNKILVEGKEVRLKKDVSERDKYGRLLRYVFIGDTFVNLELVREGVAYIATYPPDVNYQKEFSQAQKEAREAKRGLWGDDCLL